MRSVESRSFRCGEAAIASKEYMFPFVTVVECPEARLLDAMGPISRVIEVGHQGPITFSATPARYELPPPGLDEHGEEIRAWLKS